MPKPRKWTTLSPEEVARIQHLYLAGVRMEEISVRTSRSVGAIYQATKHLRRKRPPPRAGRWATRNDRILQMLESGRSRAAIAREFGLSPSQVGHVINNHPRVLQMIRRRGAKPVVLAKRFRMELSTVLRILQGGRRGERTRVQAWLDA